ncbi:flavodoxin domain-containing protein [Mumia sp. zg.B53]|uniref:flavodoxin family protein n=1 Tax=unclassified Mumia TaxID=2621872 RepID=UPI001C6F43C4|nr:MULTISPECIES: flavodoxin domain-containing protein [unclassified Mumia]MBW9204315.1 flavodoxin domain-containing protein [Mumia sp. zg.B17]MBW9209700.1 flavodoxin domain-containing protein [Mumia sp. zg.B21]MBW9214304.1 flavodoxin domain-containing protein [Mumia sp. zg.B53]MDD9348023.1 flavodoxin domain-containing protein [Mumia sp.]
MVLALVVYESLWGNTESVARAIADGIASTFGDDAVTVAEAGPDVGLDPDLALLVVGGPTHAFGMSSGATRESGRERGAPHLPDWGIREWIDALPSPGRAVRVAAFDTRTVSPRLPGSAAKKALKRLVARGFEPAAKARTFGVHGYEGPLADGELDSARAWGTELAAVVR